MDARCPQCEKIATLDDDITSVKCAHCGYEAKYDDYLEAMKERIGEMVASFTPDRSGF